MSSKTDLSTKDFVSPPEIVAIAAALFGGEIDLDPASSHNANQIVQANRFFTRENNGLFQEWKAKNVYLFPPREILLKAQQPSNKLLYEKTHQFKKSAQRVWLEEAHRKWIRQEFDQALIFLTSTEVALLSTQRIGFDFPLCILSEKPRLLVDDERLQKIRHTKALGFLYYLPPTEAYQAGVQNFYNLCSTLGRVYT
jgi:hypothetical protein